MTLDEMMGTRLYGRPVSMSDPADLHSIRLHTQGGGGAAPGGFQIGQTIRGSGNWDADPTVQGLMGLQGQKLGSWQTDENGRRYIDTPFGRAYDSLRDYTNRNQVQRAETAMNLDIHEGYRKNAEQLIPAFEAISSVDVLAPICSFFGDPPGRVVDIGAGTGRDASWLASRGFDVVAVEPVDEFRTAGMRLHPSGRIEWVDDSLPHLSSFHQREEHFDVALLVGVWQHVAPEQRPTAMRSLTRLVKSSGRLLMSVRHGPGAPSRPCFESSDSAIVGLARECGFDLIESRSAPSIQKWNRDAGVSWTWLAFGARQGDHDVP